MLLSLKEKATANIIMIASMTVYFGAGLYVVYAASSYLLLKDEGERKLGQKLIREDEN